MAMIVSKSRLPQFDGDTSFSAARRWYAEMNEVAGPIHADDGYEEWMKSRVWGDTHVAHETLEEANRVHALFAEASGGWADPDILYDIAAGGPYQIEKDHPGFVVDRSIAAAARTGWVSLPNQDVPTIVVEEGGSFVAIRVIAFEGPMSEAPIFEVVPVEGCSFGADGQIELAGVYTRRGEGESVESFDEVEGAIQRVAACSAPRP